MKLTDKQIEKVITQCHIGHCRGCPFNADEDGCLFSNKYGSYPDEFGEMVVKADVKAYKKFIIEEKLRQL